MDIFAKLRNGELVDMVSEESAHSIVELHRADKALFFLNHAEPQTEEWNSAFKELFDGPPARKLRSLYSDADPISRSRSDSGKLLFINHNFTAMSIGGIELSDNVQISPHVTYYDRQS